MTLDTADNLCWDIIEAVADERGTEPERIDERLYDVIDVESLAHLVDQAHRTDSMDLSVSFRIAECFVTVTGDQTVRASTPN
ncbi:HalOD1 output domain-containing protein [Halorubrum sp. DTA46]|uniref:HalOD1 output domain-containing protein n=1 Tax=Halorubrum sp. DTA46 TaxID=3402162 RepID=UPI003AAA4014